MNRSWRRRRPSRYEPSHTMRYDSGGVIDTQHGATTIIRQELLTLPSVREHRGTFAWELAVRQITPLGGTCKPVEDPTSIPSLNGAGG